MDLLSQAVSVEKLAKKRKPAHETPNVKQAVSLAKFGLPICQFQNHVWEVAP